MASAPPDLPIDGPPPISRARTLIRQTLPYTYTDAAVFYALLYLDVATNATVEFDLKQHTREVASGHFWYGLVYGWSEAANADGKAGFSYSGDGLAPAHPDPNTASFEGLSMASAIRRHPSYEAPLTNFGSDPDNWDEIGETLKRGFQGFTDERHADRLSAFYTHLNQAGTDSLAGTMDSAPGYSNLFTTSADPLDVQSDPVDSTRTLEELFENMTWASEFGGDAWAGVMRHLQRIADEDISLRAWVDTSFGIEHNGNGWLDKEGFEQSQFKIAGNTRNRDLQLMRRLEELLDSNQEGDMRPVFEVANQAQRRVDKYDSISVPFGRYLSRIMRDEL